jgi:hypothetical protein
MRMRSLRFESLEDRRVLASVVNVDFGDGPLAVGLAAAPESGGQWNQVTTAQAAGTGPLRNESRITS